MTVNLVTMRKLVRDRLGVPATDDFITDDIIDSSINLAIITFDSEHRWPWNETTADLTLTAGTNWYSLPTDWRAMRAVTYLHDVLEPMPAYDLDRFIQGSGGHPRYYAIVNDQIRLEPSPQNNASAKMYYYREPKLLTLDTDTTRCPDEHVMALVAKATQLCATRESERFEAQDHLAEYVLAVKRARKDVDRAYTRGVGRRIRPGAWV